ncbi:MAG: hypothetical protein K2Y29_11365 [Beijerinckiaceae bacterium]|nr:hypothetical protein [Beijerinckiaceae bacterium]
MTNPEQVAIMKSAVEGAITTFGMFLDQVVEAIIAREEQKLSRSLDPDEAKTVIDRFRQAQNDRRAVAMLLMIEGSHALAENNGG